MIYDWKCVNCGFVRESNLPGPCPQCGDRMSKRFSFSVASSFQPHYNYSVGEYVTSMQHFRDTLSRKSDDLSSRLGIDHHFTVHDHSDKLGVTDDD